MANEEMEPTATPSLTATQRAATPIRVESVPSGQVPRVALVGNPNTGKTTLFNRLSGLRHKTSNFPGTTLEARIGRVRLDIGAPVSGPAISACCGDSPASNLPPVAPVGTIDLVDLPGIYSLELDQLESRVAREVLDGAAAPSGSTPAVPDALCVVIDATNLVRNLMLAGEALRRRLPTVIAVNMIDLARRQGLSIDAHELSSVLGCRVVLISARSGEGIDELKSALTCPTIPTRTPPGDESGLRRWAEEAYATAGELADDSAQGETLTDRLDRVFTHPVGGVVVFLAIMAGLFWTIFSLAKIPMDGIEYLFTKLGSLIGSIVPEGILREFLSVGVVNGVSGTLVFLPQICLLFFLISLLEDTGYLARAAFVMDRLLRPFGLPGHSFVPLLSSHACALPGIMATRAIPDRRERLATILVAPFMTCSARLPVYVLITSVLFGDRPLMASLAFVGCYALGIFAGVTSAAIARRTILRGASRPMALELPTYKLPSLRTAGITTIDRGLMFLKKAGTNILMICIVLWWLGAYPRVDPPAEATRLREQAVKLVAESPAPASPADLGAPPTNPRATQMLDDADRLERRHAKAHSFMGIAARTIQPVFEPLGYDWQLTVGVLTSFAAREVFVSTMAVVVAGADDDADTEDAGLMDQMRSATRDDGVTPVFSRATSWSLLVFFVLAMQCLPTLAITAKESGHVKWAVLQFLWMSGLAYITAAVVFHLLKGGV